MEKRTIPQLRESVIVIPGLRIHLVQKVAHSAIAKTCEDIRQYRRTSPEEYGSEYRYMIVRHPVDRLVSAWAFFTQNNPRQIQTIEDLGFTYGMSWESFVELWKKVHYLDAHLCSQLRFKGPHKIDKLVKYENIAKGHLEVCTKFPKVQHLMVVNKSSHDSWESFPLRADIELAFKDDLELYNSGE